MAKHWFRNQELHLRRGVALDDEELTRNVENDLDGFFGEMQQAKDIHDLAKIPLLLCLLIVLKFQNARLPQSRFKAYEQLIDHLVSTHPRRRITAAGFLNQRFLLMMKILKKPFPISRYKFISIILKAL